MSKNNRRPDEDRALLVAFDHACSTFDQQLDELATGFATMETAIHAARHDGLPLPRLLDALVLARQQLAAARSVLALSNDESGMQQHMDSEQWLAEQLEAKLRAGADIKTIARFHEEFLEHEPAARIAMVWGLRAAWSIRQAFSQLGNDPAQGALIRQQLDDAHSLLESARQHVEWSLESFGPRFKRYLERYAQLRDVFAHALKR